MWSDQGYPDFSSAGSAVWNSHGPVFEGAGPGYVAQLEQRKVSIFTDMAQDAMNTKLIDNMWFRTAGYLIAGCLLACFTYTVVLVGHSFFPSWQGYYLVPIGFFTAIHAMYAFKRLRHVGFSDHEWLLYHFSEWVVIVLLVKVGYYISRGFSVFIDEMALLATRQWSSIFSGEFFFSIAVLLVVWMFSGKIAELLSQLEVNEKLLKAEQESGIYELRNEVRESLVSTILGIGIVMVLLTSIISTQTTGYWREDDFMRSGVANLLTYFFLTMFLLSLTQLNLMSTTWLREGLPLRKDLIKNWIWISIFVILLLALIAGLLPTQYSIGLLNVLDYLLSTLISVFSYLILLISAPFFMVIVFLASLFKLSGAESLQQPEPVLNLPPPPVESAQAPWIALIKSILFWSILAGMLGFAIYYFLHENKAIWDELNKLKIFQQLRKFWDWLHAKIRWANQLTQVKLQDGWQMLRSRLQSTQPLSTQPGIKLRRLSDRERVHFYYLAMLKRSAESGYARKPWQTPYEYIHELEQKNQSQSISISENQANVQNQDANLSNQKGFTNDWLADTRDLTEHFMSARFSQRLITAQEASLVKQIWNRLRKVLRNIRKG